MILETIRRTSTSLLLSWVVFCQPANAENIKVVSMISGEGLQQADQTGFYADIYFEILRQTNGQSDFSVLPFKRALNTFFSKEAECIWGLDANLLRQFRADYRDLIESSLVLNSRQYLFSTPGKPIIQEMNDVEGKTIGVLNGANTEEIFGQIAAQVVTLPSQEAKIRMLLADRVDLISAWIPDIYVTLRGLGIDRSQIEQSLYIASAGVRVVCHESPRTIEFVDAVNAAISTFVESESYQIILDEYGVPQDLR